MRRTALQAALAVLVLASVACVGPPPHRTAASYGLRMADVEAVTLVPPLVSVYAMSSGNIEQEVQEWSDAANEHAHAAVRAQARRAPAASPLAAEYRSSNEWRRASTKTGRSGTASQSASTPQNSDPA